MNIPSPPLLFTSATVLVIVGLLWKTTNIGKREGTLPPGPPTTPILGNLHQFPKDNIYVNATTADRPPNYFIDKVTDGHHTAFARYSSNWKKSRRIITEWFNKEACARRLPIQQAEATQLMFDLVHSPTDFFPLTFRYSNSLITAILAGIRSPRHDSPLVTIVHRMMHKWSSLAEPASQPPLDLIPLLRYVPSRWAPWKVAAHRLHSIQQNIYNAIIRVCDSRLQRDEGNGSAVDEVLPACAERGVSEALLRGVIASIFEGASGTTADFIRTLILLLVKHPQCQEKGQKEIDALLGCERAPRLSDFENLPYVQAIVKEYNGFFLPRGTTILVNIYGMFHDPQAYEDPEIFNPDRYLLSEFGTKENVDDTGRRHDLHYGGGRRICGGMNLANNSMAINTMNLLWAFRLSESIDSESGKVSSVDLNNFAKGLTAGPNPFKCDIVIRSPAHAAIVERDMVQARELFRGFEGAEIPHDVLEDIKRQIDFL
ncbi:cytochrome P450 [Mycena olivaceomarginata]|nr:cytochrome P450 [Mycena olivaceomarginata]